MIADPVAPCAPPFDKPGLQLSTHPLPFGFCDRPFWPHFSPPVLFGLLPWVERLAASIHSIFSCVVQLRVFFSLLSLAALRLVSGILHVSPRPGLVKLLWLSRLRHHCFTARLQGPSTVVSLSNSSSTPPTCPLIVRHLSSRFCTPGSRAIPGLHTPKF